MSGNAALAAAKRRRNPVESVNNNTQQQRYMENQNVDTNSLRTNREQGSSVHPLQVVLQHDRQLFDLERKLETLHANTNLDNSPQNMDELDSLVRNNSSEIRLMKNTLQKQQKTIQELSSMLTSLKGAYSSHDNLLNELTDQLAKAPEVETVSVSTEMEATEDGVMKLDISEQ